MCQRSGYLDFKVMGWGVEPASIQQMGAPWGSETLSVSQS